MSLAKLTEQILALPPEKQAAFLASLNDEEIAELETGVAELETIKAAQATNIGNDGFMTPGFDSITEEGQQVSPNPGMFESMVGGAEEEITALPGEIKAANERPDLFTEGMKIGLVQEQGMQKEATRLGVNLEDPAIQAGIKLTQLGKAGAEIVVMDLLTGGLGPAVSIALKNPAIKKSIGPVIETMATSIKGSNILKPATDVVEGALAGAGANLGANLSAGTISEALGGEGLSKKNLDATTGESVLTGALSGVLNPIAKAGLAKEGRTIGASQLAADEGRILNAAADEVTTKAAAGEANSVDVVKNVYKQRAEELAPVKARADALEARFLKSKETIDIKEVPGQLTDFVKQLRNKTFGESVSQSPEGREVLRMFKDHIDLVGDKAVGSIKKSDLLALKDNVDSIMTKGFTKDGKAEFGKAAGYAKANNVRSKTVDMLPNDFKEVDNAFKTIHNRYGNRFSDDFADMNNVYNKLDKGEAISKEDAISFITNPKSSVASKKIGEFADQGILDVNDIENAFFTKNSSVGKDFTKSVNTGRQSDSIVELEAGKTPAQIASSQGANFTDKPFAISAFETLTGQTGKNIPRSITPKGERFVDPQKVAGGLIKDEASLKASMGSNTQKAQEITDQITTLNFLKRKGPKAVKEAASEAAMSKKVEEGITGLDLGAQIDPVTVQTNILLNKGLQTLSPSLLRQGLQSGAGFFTGNKFDVAGR